MARHGRRTMSVALCASLALAALAPIHAQSTAAGWSLDEYQRLSAEMDAADEDRVLATRGTASWREATLAAIESRRQLVAYIGSSVRYGSMPAELLESAAAARLVLIQNIVVLQVELGNCDQASAAVRLLDDAAGSANTEVERARSIALESVAECEPHADAVAGIEPGTGAGTEGSGQDTAANPVGVGEGSGASDADAQAASGTPGDAFVGEAPPLRRGRAQRITGISLLGLGTGMALGGLAWDAANALGPRADFTAERNQCPDCDTARLDDLASEIDGAKVPIGVLLFGGIAVAGAGTAIWLTAPGDRAEVALVPTLGGAQAVVRLGGRARR